MESESRAGAPIESDAIIVHAKGDEGRARAIAGVVEARSWSVILHDAVSVEAGWFEVVRQEMKSAHCVVFLWTKSSIRSRPVLDRAEAASSSGSLFSVWSDDIEVPSEFAGFPVFDLHGWEGDSEDPRLQELADAIGEFIARRDAERDAEAKADPRAQKAVEFDEAPIGPAAVEDESVRVFDGHSGSVYGVAVTPDGRRCVSASDDRTLRVWDLETGATLRTLEGHEDAVVAVAATPDGRRCISASGDNTLRVWDLETGATLRTLEGHEDAVFAVAVTPDGRRCVSASYDRTLRVWDLETGATLRTLEGHEDMVFAVAATPDGRRCVSASGDKTIRVWDLETGATLRTLEGHKIFIAAVAVTPDGRRCVSGSGDRSLRVWDLETGAALRTLEGHEDAVAAVAVTPDGRRCVSASYDHTLRVWDLETGATLGTLEGHGGSVIAVAVTPDGRRCVSGSDDGTLRLWNLPGADAASRAETEAPGPVHVFRDGAAAAQSDAVAETDRLARGTLIAALSAMLTDPDQGTPFTIGLFGNWGSGKSSVMDQLRGRLREEEAPKVVFWRRVLRLVLSPDRRDEESTLIRDLANEVRGLIGRLRGAFPRDALIELARHLWQRVVAGKWPDDKGRPRFVFADFNAWQYENTENLAAGLAQETVRGLTGELGAIGRLALRFLFAWRQHRTQFLGAVVQLVGGLAALGFGVHALLKAGTLGVATGAGGTEAEGAWTPLLEGLVGVGGAAFVLRAWPALKKLYEHPVSTELRTYLKLPNYGDYLGHIPVLRSHIEDLWDIRRKKWLHPLDRRERRLVVFVDDLDRCTSGAILKSLEAIRLVMDLEGVVVVVAMDARMALQAVAHEYEALATETRSKEDIARDYLGKIFQLPVRLGTPSEKSIEDYVRKALFSTPAPEATEETPEATVRPPVTREPEKAQGRHPPVPDPAQQADPTPVAGAPAEEVVSDTPVEPGGAEDDAKRPARERWGRIERHSRNIWEEKPEEWSVEATRTEMVETEDEIALFVDCAKWAKLGNPRQLRLLRDTYRLLKVIHRHVPWRALMIMLFWQEALHIRPQDNYETFEKAAHEPDNEKRRVILDGLEREQDGDRELVEAFVSRWPQDQDYSAVRRAVESVRGLAPDLRRVAAARAVMVETEAEVDLFVDCAKWAGLGNPRQLRRLRNSYRLLKAVHRRLPWPALMIMLFWQEALHIRPQANYETYEKAAREPDETKRGEILDGLKREQERDRELVEEFVRRWPEDQNYLAVRQAVDDLVLPRGTAQPLREAGDAREDEPKDDEDGAASLEASAES